MKLPKPETIVSWAGWITAALLAALSFLHTHPLP